MRNTSALNNFESKVDEKLTAGITAVFKPYEASIKDIESHYKLKTLAMQADSLNLSVNKDLVRFFESCQRKVIRQIYRQIESRKEEPEFSLENIKLILKENKIEKEVSSTVISAINSPMLISLSLEDCYMAFKKSSKICSLKLDCDNQFRHKLRLAKAKSAIVIIYGTPRTKLHDLNGYWDVILRKANPKIPIGFSYNIKPKLKKEKMYALIGY